MEIYVNRIVQDQLPGAITRKMLKKETEKDPKLKKLMEDIGGGTCRPALHQFQQVFSEITQAGGILMRGEQLLIPEGLQAHAIQLAHEGHLGVDKTLGLLRQSTWFPNMGNMVREFVETCLPCQAAQGGTSTEPIRPTPFPDRPWQHLHADYKGPIGGSWYMHVLIDQYSKFPVVNVVKSTKYS